MVIGTAVAVGRGVLVGTGVLVAGGKFVGSGRGVLVLGTGVAGVDAWGSCGTEETAVGAAQPPNKSIPINNHPLRNTQYVMRFTTFSPYGMHGSGKFANW